MGHGTELCVTTHSYSQCCVLQGVFIWGLRFHPFPACLIAKPLHGQSTGTSISKVSRWRRGQEPGCPRTTVMIGLPAHWLLTRIPQMMRLCTFQMSMEVLEKPKKRGENLGKNQRKRVARLCLFLPDPLFLWPGFLEPARRWSPDTPGQVL